MVYGTADLEVIIVANNPPLKAWPYPDSDKWGVNAPRKFFRTCDVD